MSGKNSKLKVKVNSTFLFYVGNSVIIHLNVKITVICPKSTIFFVSVVINSPAELIQFFFRELIPLFILVVKRDKGNCVRSWMPHNSL